MGRLLTLIAALLVLLTPAMARAEPADIDAAARGVVRVVIIGAIAGGATAAARLHRLDENIEVTLVDKTNEISRASCGEPYLFSGTVDRKHLQLQRPIYARSAAYGHFGRTPDSDGGFSWEKTDLVDDLKDLAA